jgi:hypothetical protein
MPDPSNIVSPSLPRLAQELDPSTLPGPSFALLSPAVAAQIPWLTQIACPYEDRVPWPWEVVEVRICWP